MRIRLVAALVLAGVANGQGDYAPVTAADVPTLKLNHYFTPDMKGGRTADFEWTFTKDGFTIKKGKAAIPADLVGKLLGEKAAADEITGKWTVDAGQLVLTDVKAGETKGKESVKLRIYRTAPTVVRVGEPQYVFGVGR
jgi:hypothetical protein